MKRHWLDHGQSSGGGGRDRPQNPARNAGLLCQRFFDQVSLEDIVEGAGVTVQTILRRFSCKDDLIAAAAHEARQSIKSPREEVPIGDVAGAIKALVFTYEEHGDRVLRLLAQEERVAAFRLITDAGRAYHRQWAERVFAPFLANERAPSANASWLSQSPFAISTPGKCYAATWASAGTKLSSL